MIHTFKNERWLISVAALCLYGFLGGLSAVASASTVKVATYEGVINPVTAEYFEFALDEAVETDAHLLVFQLDTPGGLDTSMRLIINRCALLEMFFC